jgi:hypothetical protein
VLEWNDLGFVSHAKQGEKAQDGQNPRRIEVSEFGVWNVGFTTFPVVRLCSVHLASGGPLEKEGNIRADDFSLDKKEGILTFFTYSPTSHGSPWNGRRSWVLGARTCFQQCGLTRHRCWATTRT